MRRPARLILSIRILGVKCWPSPSSPTARSWRVGIFSSIGGQSRNLFARIDGATGAADSFQPNPYQIVYAITVQNDGKIVVGGDFGVIGAETRNHIARLLPEGGLPAIVGNVSTRLPVG